jgi:lipoyl(octanoyl) transferase
LLQWNSIQNAYAIYKKLKVKTMINIQYLDLGVKDYKETWDYQEELLRKVMEMKNDPAKSDFGGYLIFVEHPHVYTLGKSGETNNLLISESFLKQINATYYEINRGGDITYHGPGQIVGYPIIDLDKFNMGVKEYVHKLEDSIIATLKDFNIESSRMDGATGVWLDTGTPRARKICAIGVRVSRSVTMHGFAFNVNTDLQYFSYINPCGFQDKGVTSLEKELKEKQDFGMVKSKVIQKMQKVFGAKIV